MNYTGCANPNNDPRGDWCPTELNEDGEFSGVIAIQNHYFVCF